jgi:hypothetical protein
MNKIFEKVEKKQQKGRGVEPLTPGGLGYCFNPCSASKANFSQILQYMCIQITILLPSGEVICYKLHIMYYPSIQEEYNLYTYNVHNVFMMSGTPPHSSCDS